MIKHSETILVVEDDAQIRNFITYTLKQEGFPCLTAGTAQNALTQLVSGQIDLVLLDLGLPDFDGMEVIKKVREWSEVPIIVVSARDQDNEKASALDNGADDYLTKPFSATELMARIRVALRHSYKAVGNKAQTVFTVGGLSIDLERHQVSLDGENLHVTPMEYNLLALFFKNIGKVLTTQYIINEIYGPGYGNDTQALRALMAALRRKIEKSPAKPRYILTEIGVGYRLVDESPPTTTPWNELPGRFRLPVSFFLEVVNAAANDQCTQHDYCRIAISPMQFRHIGKVHSVPACDQGQRHENCGNNCQKLHDPVLSQIYLSLVFTADLTCIFPQHLGFFL